MCMNSRYKKLFKTEKQRYVNYRSILPMEAVVAVQAKVV